MAQKDLREVINIIPEALKNIGISPEKTPFVENYIINLLILVITETKNLKNKEYKELLEYLK